MEDICAVTKVSPQNVRFLEAGSYADLPGGVFRKGIVRSYVGALGLEEAVWLERFEQSCQELGVATGGERDWVEFAENVKKNRTQKEQGMGWRWVGVILLVLALAGGAWAAWHYVIRQKIAAHSAPAPATPVAPAAVPPVDPPTGQPATQPLPEQPLNQPAEQPTEHPADPPPAQN